MAHGDAWVDGTSHYYQNDHIKSGPAEVSRYSKQIQAVWSTDWTGGRGFPHPSRPALGPTQPPL